ncbi:MAG: phage major capsid protein, partial [Oscillospiraceae bacterium]
GIRDDVLADFNAYQRTQDKSILTARGVRQLTEAEEKFYKAMITAAETGDIKQAFEGLPNAYPESVMDSVLSDIQSTYPLLGAISMQNTSTMTKMIVNKKGVQLAVWGALNSAITKELEGAIGVIELGTNKLSAYMPVAKDMLAVGPLWVDAYVRAVLVEAAAAGLSKAVVMGTGKDEPIGMLKSVADNVTITGGVYPDKTPMVITDLSPLTFGKIATKIAQGPNARKRAVPELLCVVNPVDYFEKIFPATTFLTPAGTYVHNVLPYPTKIIQDENVPDGKMIVGLASRYFMGIGVGGSGGKIEFSDEFRFLEDQRVYLTKLYGNGRALDDNAFILCDITAIKPHNLEVTVAEVKGTVTTKAAAV